MARSSAGFGVSGGISRARKYHCKASVARSEGFLFSLLAARLTRRPTAAGNLIVYFRLLISSKAGYHLTRGCQGEAESQGLTGACCRPSHGIWPRQNVAFLAACY